MVKSMTGYGKGEYGNKLYRFKVELRSVNHRYNDIYVKMPRHLIYFEEMIKKRIKKDVHRGKVDVFIDLEYIEDSAIDVKVDLPLARSYKNSLDLLIEELGLDDKVRLTNVLYLPEVIRKESREPDDQLLEEALTKALDQALDNLYHMRLAEGTALKRDILLKLELIEELLNNIEKRSPKVSVEYEERLRSKLNEILKEAIPLDEDRLNNEIAYFIDKSGIDEEITRLESHIDQLKDILEEESSIGRKLDFLIQEFNREINTIGSKANDEEISKYVVDFKAEIEKIREQVQNIE